ncbi:MAG: NADH-quinone oxidoreductase subunit J [Candidatus Schmidhempelia sp.]|nr:NADH-quinone oxidoreductase subunit J [Candidatus Schmidhempelia sp.]
MVSIFYISSIIAILASFKVVTSTTHYKALLYLVISLFASAAIFYSLGAYYSTALEVILFVGVTTILFISVRKYLDFSGAKFKQQEKQNLAPKFWLGPLILIFILLVTLLYSVAGTDYSLLVSDKSSSLSFEAMLLGPYMLIIELAALLILGITIVAYHFINDLSTIKDSTYGKQRETNKVNTLSKKNEDKKTL